MTASRFKDTRLMCCLSVPDAGKLFRVSERTIRNWEAGRVGIPYAAFKLMRIVRGYELPGQYWKGFRLRGDTLWSPEGKAFKASDHTWWSLTCCMANHFRRHMAAERASRGKANGVAVADLAAPLASVLSLGESSFMGVAPEDEPVLRSGHASPVTLPGPLSESKPLETSPSPPVRRGTPRLAKPRVVTRGALIGRQIGAGVLA